jgi:hypothetical protein
MKSRCCDEDVKELGATIDRINDVTISTVKCKKCDEKQKIVINGVI